MPEESQSFSKSAGGKRKALHKKYIVGAHRAPLQLRTQAVGAVYDRPGFFVQSPRGKRLEPAMKTFENFSLTKCYAQENIAIHSENQPQ